MAHYGSNCFINFQEMDGRVLRMEGWTVNVNERETHWSLQNLFTSSLGFRVLRKQ